MIMIPFFDKFMKVRQSQSVDLPAYRSLQVFADASPSGLPLPWGVWPIPLNQDGRAQNSGARHQTPSSLPNLLIVSAAETHGS